MDIKTHKLANKSLLGTPIARARGAAVDVFMNEPDIGDCPLIGLDNVILTPHISASSPVNMVRVPPMVMENLDRVYAGEPPVRVVN